MIKAYALAGLAAALSGCAAPAAAWKGKIEWPADYSGKNIVPFMDARAALAAAAAVREVVRTNPFPNLFWGCSTPEQGLDVAVYTGPTPGLYYVLVDQRFDRCGGPRVRVLDGWYEYAVTSQGEVVAEAPPPAAEEDPLTPEPTPSPDSPSAGSAPESPAPAPPPNPTPSPSPEVLPSPSPSEPAIPEAQPQPSREDTSDPDSRAQNG